jgi:hypothetical protein
VASQHPPSGTRAPRRGEQSGRMSPPVRSNTPRPERSRSRRRAAGPGPLGLKAGRQVASQVLDVGAAHSAGGAGEHRVPSVSPPSVDRHRLNGSSHPRRRARSTSRTLRAPPIRTPLRSFFVRRMPSANINPRQSSMSSPGVRMTTDNASPSSIS